MLSTCNRSEVYGVPPETSHECAPGLSNFLSEFHSVRMDVLGVSLYHHYDREAVRHLFRVAAGLDSMMATSRVLDTSRRSDEMKSALPPAVRISATVFSPRSTLRPTTKTWMPSRASLSAAARPIPLVPPVISAVDELVFIDSPFSFPMT